MEKNKDVKIEKMVLNIEGEKVSLSMEQAKKLKNILDELFGKEIIKEVVEKHHYHNDWYYRPYQILCGTSASPDTNKFFCADNTLNLTV